MDNSQEPVKDPKDYIRITADDSSSEDEVTSQDVRILERRGFVSIGPWGSWRRVVNEFPENSFPSTGHLIEASMRYKKEKAALLAKKKEDQDEQENGFVKASSAMSSGDQTKESATFAQSTGETEEHSIAQSTGETEEHSIAQSTGETEEHPIAQSTDKTEEHPTTSAPARSAFSEYNSAQTNFNGVHEQTYGRLDKAKNNPYDGATLEPRPCNKRTRLEGNQEHSNFGDLKWKFVSDSNLSVSSDMTYNRNNSMGSQPQYIHPDSRMNQSRSTCGFGNRRYSSKKNRHQNTNSRNRKQHFPKTSLQETNENCWNEASNQQQQQDNLDRAERPVKAHPRNILSTRNHFQPNRNGKRDVKEMKKSNENRLRTALVTRNATTPNAAIHRTFMDGIILIVAIVMSVLFSWWIGRYF